MGNEARKVVTVLFSDVSGSTALGEELDPEALRRVMARYFEEMRTVIERHGGTVEKFIGDAVMAVFGIPLVHEDDALRAVRAAAEMREALATLNEELARERGIRIEIRTGVNTGEVVAGDPSQGQSFATGDTVNVAARLEQAAEPGEILVGEQTYRLVRDAVTAQPVAPLALKGKAEGVPAWRLFAVREGAPAFARRFDSPLVGRRGELDRLRAAYERSVGERAPLLVTVLGEAGVGKSRLTSEFLAPIEEARVLVGRCLSYGEGITYWPLVGMVEALEQEAPLAALLAATEDGTLIAARVYAAIGRAEAPGSTEETFWAVRKLIGALAGGRPLVLVVDDVHWAEPTFLDLLEHLADWIHDTPILLLALARPEFLDSRPGWPGERIALAPLSESESETLLETLSSDVRLSAEMHRRVVEAAEGNPLFVEQLLAMLAEDGHGGELAVPPTIQALLAARIDRLPADERGTIERASVVGKEFWHGALVALSPDAAEVTVPLQRLVRKQFLRPGPSTFSGEDAFRFRHILIRDAAYLATSKELRAELHERFADWLEERSTEYDEIVGYHLEQAYRYAAELGPVDGPGQALAQGAGERLTTAGRRALMRGDVRAATNLLERAYSLFPGDRARLDIVRELFEAHHESGELEKAERLADEAAELAVREGDDRDRAIARLLQAELKLSRDPEGWSDAALHEAERAIPLFETVEDDRSLARAWDLVHSVAWLRGDLERAREAARRGLHHAEAIDDVGAQAALRAAVLASFAFGATPVADSVRSVEEELVWARGAGVHWHEGMALVARGCFAAMQGDLEAARAFVGDGTSVLTDLGMRLVSASLVGNWAPVLCETAEEEERELRIAYTTLSEAGERAYFSTIAAQLADALYRQGRYDEAAQLVAESEEAGASDDVTTHIRVRCVRAKLLARQGRLEEAEILARKAVERALASDYYDLTADTFMDLAEVLRLAGRPADAARAIQEALAMHDAKGNLRMANRARALIETLAPTAPG